MMLNLERLISAVTTPRVRCHARYLMLGTSHMSGMLQNAPTPSLCQSMHPDFNSFFLVYWVLCYVKCYIELGIDFSAKR